MNFNPNNQNTLLTKKVAALYEAMQKAGDSGLAFMVVDSLNSLANYASFLAEQEILIQQARITMEVFIMSNNKEIICKLIKAKNQEANSYTDQTCYNAAYCYGYVDGATMALNTLSGVPERHKCYAILSHYSNEDIGTFDSVAICGGVHMSFESAKKAADEMLAVDKENGCHDDAVPYTLDDCKEFDDLPLYIAGEWVKDEFERYHNFYAVFEQDAAL